MAFRVGQKVVCIRAVYPSDCPPPFPSVGTIATVSWVGFGGEIIDLLEFPSPETDGWHRGYEADDWRPLVERKTDISVFTAMLNTSKQGQDA